MKRLILAALAALSLGATVGSAASFFACAQTSRHDSSSGPYNRGGTDKGLYFQAGANCAAGTGGCCWKYVVDINRSTDGGATWHSVTHLEPQYNDLCGQSNPTHRTEVQLVAGLYQMAETIKDCAGNVIQNFPTIQWTVP